MGIVPKDPDEKVRRGYVEKDSIVWADGREKLVGRDWRKRKKELKERSRGRCEMILKDARGNPFRCLNSAEDPHHRIRRSVLRNDQIENLLFICRPCHRRLDHRQVMWTKR